MLEGGSFTHSSVAEFLNKAVEPPPEISVSNAVRLLQDIGAFEVSACFPVHCIISALPGSEGGCTGLKSKGEQQDVLQTRSDICFHDVITPGNTMRKRAGQLFTLASTILAAFHLVCAWCGMNAAHLQGRRQSFGILLAGFARHKSRSQHLRLSLEGGKFQCLCSHRPALAPSRRRR